MPISDWSDLMTHEVSYQSVVGRNEYGKPVLSTAKKYKCHFTYKSRTVMSKVTGQETLVSATLWLAGVILSINQDDAFTFPDGRTPNIATWSTFVDEKGTHHTKVDFI